MTGSASFDHANLLYAQYGARLDYGNVIMNASIIAHAQRAAIRSDGTLTATNCVFMASPVGINLASGMSIVRNCTITNTDTPVTGCNGAFANCAIAYMTSACEAQCPAAYQSCAFYNPPGYGPQSAAQVGENGNIWAEPRFHDWEKGDFRLRPDSPLIDAAAGENAPQTDYFGAPRCDDPHVPNTGTPTASGTYADIGAVEMTEETSPPGAVTEPAIADGGNINGGQVTLSWSPSRLAQYYDVYLWQSGDTPPAEPIARHVTNPSLELPFLLQEGVAYAWRVDAVNPSGVTPGTTWTFTVAPRNDAPVLAPIGNKTVGEGEVLTFIVTATDPNGDALTFSASNLPNGATLDAATGLFVWTPGFDSAGEFKDIVFTATDNGIFPATSSETITIAVNDVNRAPILEPIGNQAVEEGGILTFSMGASDPDGDTLAFSASNLPAGASFDAATQTFAWSPAYGDAGNYADVLFKVTDDGTPPLAAAEAITISVGNVNRPPVLEPIGLKMIDEGHTLTFACSATDPDGDCVMFSASNLPPGTTFDPARGLFEWTPGFDASGVYAAVAFAVTDSGIPPLQDIETVTITVGNANRPPVLLPIGNQVVAEGSTLEFTVAAADPDGDVVEVSASSLPSGAAFDKASQRFTWTPGYDEPGTYAGVLFTVTDNGTPPLGDWESIAISVGNVNRPPVLSSIGNQYVEEGQALSFLVSASDPDGDALSFEAAGLPDGSDFDPETHTFTWQPGYDASGNYSNVVFSVTDGGEPPETDQTAITITVGNVNRPPTLTPIGNRAITGGETATFVVTASDPDGDNLLFSASNLPAGAIFDSSRQVFTWAPASGIVGEFAGILFTVTDAGTPAESCSETITITVEPASGEGEGEGEGEGDAGCFGGDFHSETGSQSGDGLIIAMVMLLFLRSVVRRARHEGIDERSVQ